MSKVILFGATGNLGKAIAKELIAQGYELTIVVRSETKAKSLKHLTDKYIVADVCNPKSIQNVCEGQDIVISALGKSVSVNDKSKPTFRDVDLNANTSILEEAKKSGVKKFIYISAFQAETMLHLEYFNVHHLFSERLKASGIDYSIIKPPAIFCAFLDMIDMAKKGKLINLGSGEHKTNPIYEGDLGKIIVESIKQHNVTIEAGGKKVYSRKELNEIIQDRVDNSKKIRTVPLAVFKLALPIIKVFNKNSYDKFAFFAEVIQHDTIAPQHGEKTFEEYISENLN